MEFSGFHSPEYKQIDWKDYKYSPEVLSKELSKRKICHSCGDNTSIEPFIENTSNWLPKVPQSTPYNRGYVVSVNSSNTTVNWMPPAPSPTTTSIPNSTTSPPFLLNTNIDSVSQNMNTIQNINQENTSKQIINQFIDLSHNVGATIDKMGYLYHNKKYQYWGKEDPNVLIHPEESQDIQTALQKDVTDMRLYQNSIYVTTAIACATLLIGAIIISK